VECNHAVLLAQLYFRKSPETKPILQRSLQSTTAAYYFSGDRYERISRISRYLQTYAHPILVKSRIPAHMSSEEVTGLPTPIWLIHRNTISTIC